MKKQLLFIVILLISVMIQAQVSKTVSCIAGELSTALTTTEKSTVSNLTITGTIDARDFLTMKDSLSAIKTIDLSNCSIQAFTGKLNKTYFNPSTYLANEIPTCAFFRTKKSRT